MFGGLGRAQAEACLTFHPHRESCSVPNGAIESATASRFVRLLQSDLDFLSRFSVERNPVRAGMVDNPAEWQWSSAGAHLYERTDPLVDPAPSRRRVEDWAGYLAEGLSADEVAMLEKHLLTGRPLGNPQFIERVERVLGRVLQKQRPGPKAKPAADRQILILSPYSRIINGTWPPDRLPNDFTVPKRITQSNHRSQRHEATLSVASLTIRRWRAPSMGPHNR